MADIDITPVMPVVRDWPGHCRNGMVPNGYFVRFLANALDYVPAYLRKVPLMFSQNLQSIEANTSAGTTNMWRARMRSGYGTAKIGFHCLFARPKDAAAVDSRINLAIVDVDDVSTSDATIRYNFVDTAATDVPDEYAWGQAEAVIIAGNRLELLVEAEDFARPLSCCVYEIGTNPVDTDTTAIADPRITVGSPILDSQQSNLLVSGTQLWKQNAGNILNWSANTAANAATVVATAYTNILDASSTTVTSSTPGYHVNLQYHNSASATTVPVEMAIYAQRTAGVGDTAFNKVRLTDGTNSVEVTGVGNTAGWFTATGTITASADLKMDLQGNVAAGDTMKVHAVSVYEWEA